MTFEIGKTYWTNSICDTNCIWEYKIEKRTEKSVWINGNRFGIKRNYEGNEMIYPLGKYSMAPMLTADRIA